MPAYLIFLVAHPASVLADRCSAVILASRCHNSNQLIWFKYGWCGYRIISGPGDPVIIKKWLTEQEYVMYLLKNNH